MGTIPASDPRPALAVHPLLAGGSGCYGRPTQALHDRREVGQFLMAEMGQFKMAEDTLRAIRSLIACATIAMTNWSVPAHRDQARESTIQNARSSGASRARFV